MMKNLITIGYWIGVMLLLSLILKSLGYAFGQALFVAVLWLPGMCCLKLQFEGFQQTAHRRPVVLISLMCGIVLLEWLVLFFTHSVTHDILSVSDPFPAIFLNPLFILLVLAAVVAPEQLLSRWLRNRLPRMQSLSFVSERRKITLELFCILYVESNDNEVFIHAANGCSYRTRTRISQWEKLLDDRFVRIHRAYLVNADRVTGFTGNLVTIGGNDLPVSRSYRSSVVGRLAPIIRPVTDDANSSRADVVASGSSRNPM